MIFIGEKTIADAVLDRIVHQAIRVELKGDSLRKKNLKKNRYICKKSFMFNKP